MKRIPITFLVVLAAGCKLPPIQLPPMTQPGQPTSAPTPPTPAPTPEPPKPTQRPAACPVIQDDDSAVVDQTELFASDYAAGILALQRRHPDWFVFDEFGHWQAPRAGDKKQYPTPPAVQAFREQFYAELGAEFAKSLLCTQTIGDELHVFDGAHTSARPIISDRYKPFEQGGGRQMQKAFMGRTLAIGQAAPPAPATPTPGPAAPSTPGPGPSASTCPAGSPPVNKYLVACRIRNANFAFCDSTPKVHDPAYCAPNADCPYKGGEGTAARQVCELALARPVWVLGQQRDDNPFSADVPRGSPWKVCHLGADGAATDPCLSGVAP